MQLSDLCVLLSEFASQLTWCGKKEAKWVIPCQFRLALSDPDDKCNPAAAGGRQAARPQGEMVETNARGRTVWGESQFEMKPNL